MIFFMLFLLVSIVVGGTLFLYGALRIKDPWLKCGYVAFMGILLGLLTVYFCSLIKVVLPATFYAVLLWLGPAIAFCFLVFTVAVLNLQTEHKIIVRAYALNTVIYMVTSMYEGVLCVRHGLPASFFMWYAVQSVAVGVFIALVWTHQSFKRSIELSQARISTYLIASIMMIIGGLSNIVFFDRSGVFWVFLFFVPYFFVMCSVAMKSAIVFVERLLQQLLVKITLLLLYYGMFMAMMMVCARFDLIAIKFFYERVVLGYVLFMVFSYRLIDKAIFRFFKHFFFRPLVNYPLLFRNFSHAILAVVDVDRIASMIVNMFYDGYGIERVWCFMYNTTEKKYFVKASVGCEGGDAVDFDNDHSFVRIVEKRMDMIGKDALRKMGSDESLKLFANLQVELCIPFEYKNGLLGFIFLGEKKDGTKYHDDDLKLFSIIEGQISVAMNNAFFFETQRESFGLMAQKNKMDAIIALSSGVNHEINNPLSIISMKSQNFLRKATNDKFASKEEALESATEVIESCLRNAGRAHMITRRLGNFAKPSKDATEMETLDLATHITDCIAFTGEGRFEKDNISLKIDVPEDLPKISCDTSHLQQILFNVIMNAYHAVEQNGEIAITARDEGSMVVLAVRDNGCGIKPADMEKIWEPFFTTKPQQPSAENKFTGTGLGLALVKRYVEHSRGTVRVVSAPEKGTTFYLGFLKAADA